MFCTKCGAKNDDRATFCTNCGAPLRKAETSTPQPTETPQPAATQPTATPQMQPVQQAAPAYEQPTAAFTQQAATYAQPGTQQTYAQPVHQPPKKKNLGKILGLSIGIPVGALVLIAGLVVLITRWNASRIQYSNQPANNGHIAANGGSVNGTSGHSNSGHSGNDGDDINNGNGGSASTSNTASGSYQLAEPDENIISEDNATRTLMVYIVGSDLETDGGYASADIAEICDADLPDNVNIVLECGGSLEWENNKIPDGEVTRFKVENGDIVKLEELGEISMTRPGKLSDFIKFSRDNFPANNYTLILWNHGGGIPVGFGCDELGDYYDTMCDYEIRAELAEANVKFDAVLFDACNMCTLEMARALEGYADYMVGAESYVNGTGMYYTSWLSSLDGDPRAFSEKIVQDYMEQNRENGLIGSMSVIRLDYIDLVYDAYVNYLAEATEALDYGDYSNYYQARGNCGYYESNDSVDLITLATSYNNSYSTPLMNAVVNAVVYTESDFVYGHGLMAYSPYESYDMYDEGRQSFVELGYDSDIMKFYDNFVSRELAYFEGDYSGYSSADWYYDDYNEEAAEVTQTMSGYELSLVDMGNYYAVDAPQELWDNLDNISEAVLVQLEDCYWMMGQEYTYTTDDDGNLALVNPENWTTINGQTVTYYCIDYYDDGEGNWAQTGIVPILINGEGALLYLYYDNYNPYGVVQGYSNFNYETEEEGDDIYGIGMDDEITLVGMYMDENFDVFYQVDSEPFNAEEIQIGYSDATYLYENYYMYGYYEAMDVYGNAYQTEFEELGDRSYLE